MKKRFGWMGAVWAVVFVMCGGARAYDLNEGLIAYYPLTNDATDVSGNGMDGTVMSGVTFSDGAAVFDGSTNAWIDLPDGFSDFTNGFTFTGWVRFDSFDENYSRVFDLSLGENSQNILVAHQSTNSSFAYNAATGSELVIGSFFTSRQWVYVSVVHNTNETVGVYMNGTLVDQSYSTPLPNAVTRTENFLGRSAWAQDGYLNGALRELRFYNRALDAAEVSAALGQSGRTIYVGAGGSSAPPYLDPSTATTLLTDALGVSLPGDTVLITRPFALQAPSATKIVVPERVTVRGANGPLQTVIRAFGYVDGFLLQDGSRLEGLTISGFSESVYSDFYFPSGDPDLAPVVYNCIISQGEAGLLGDSGGATGVKLDRCIIQDTVSITEGALLRCKAYNCLIINNRAMVSTFAGGLSDCTAVNCTIIGNGDALGESVGVSGSTLTNCIVLDNTVTGTTLSHSIYSGAMDGVDGNITNAPIFLAEAYGDYRLVPASPGVDAGLNGAATSMDLNGRTRISGGSVDMGAYETIDSDSDGLSDGQEQMIYGTDPEVADSDGDGYDDGHEVQLGLSPSINNTSFLGAYVQSNANAYGYYDTNAVLDLHVGDIGMAVSNGTANLSLQMEASNDLNNWTNAGDSVSWSIPVDSSNKFFRVRANP